MSLYFVSIPPKKLSQSITSASLTFRLNNIKSWKRNSLGVTINLTSADFGTRAFGCFRNDTGTKIEIFEFDPATIASSNITILKRGLDFNGDLTTETAAYKLDWSANETTVQLGTDVPQLFQYLKEYIDAASIAGSVPASTTVLGIVEEATQAEVDAGTATGGTGGRLFVNPSTLANAAILGLTGAPVIATAATTTLSLTTIASQRVIVWAKGYLNTSGTSTSVTLAYNGVTKDTVTMGIATVTNWRIPFALMYTETPGAGTHDIVVSGGTDVQIIVLKL